MDEPKIPTDEYSRRLRELANNPAAIEKDSKVELSDFYGNSVTWTVKTIRTEGADVVFLQRITADLAPIRLVLPPEVTATMARQRDGIIDVSNKRRARSAAATRKAK